MFIKKLPFRGDTIIEVLISITVVSAVLGGAYVSANRSLNATRQAQERGESLKLAEEQLERLKSMAKIQPAIFTDPDSDFLCISEDLTYRALDSAELTDLEFFEGYPDECKQKPQAGAEYDGVYYFIVIERVGDGTFIIHSTWNRANGLGNDTLELVYRLYPWSAFSSGVAAPEPPDCDLDPTAEGCEAAEAEPDPGLPEPTIDAAPKRVLVGTRTTIEWTVKNADRCIGTNDDGNVHSRWNRDELDLDYNAAGVASGSARTDYMNSRTNFHIQCWKGTKDRIKTVAVNIYREGDPVVVDPPPGGPGGEPATPGEPGDVCGISTYFAHPGPIGHGHEGGDGVGGDGGDGSGGDACTGDAGSGGGGGSSAPGGNGQPSRPSNPSAPSGSSGTICTTKNGVKTCVEQ